MASAYTPHDLRTAYNFSPLYTRHIDGTGQTVAVIEMDRLSLPALTAFDRAYNLSAPRLTQQFVGGKPFPIKEDGEADLDVEWLHALAPGAAIKLFYVGGPSDRVIWNHQIVSALHTIQQRGIKTVAISLWACPGMIGIDRIITAMAAAKRAGISIFVASGDNGSLHGSLSICAPGVSLDYPAGDPSVVSVGGTTLHLDARRHIAAETGWRGSSGGPYIDPLGRITRPAWQVAPTLPHDNLRYAPDVAFLADEHTGVSATADGHWVETGGTSLGAPAWAAIWALLRQNAARSHVSLATAPNVLYAVARSARSGSAFHDITRGSSGGFTAHPGWDPVTGWGTPNVANLAAAVLLHPR